MKIQGSFFPAGLTTVPKSMIQSALKMSNRTDFLSPLTISPGGSAKSEFLERFRRALNPDSSPAAYIPSYAEAYAKIREEILSRGDGAQETSLKLLDEVYGEVTGEAADRLADSFDAFFNGINRHLAGYRMAEGPPEFDREAFRSHLTGLAEEAKRIALAHPGEVASNLKNGGPADTLESMGYRDIEALSGALQAVSSTRPPIAAGGDPAKFGAAVGNWEADTRRILNAAGLSDSVKDASLRQLHANAQPGSKRERKRKRRTPTRTRSTRRLRNWRTSPI
ncbi:hypothetical protein [Cohnella sp. JJ-181]|uniref:hypothetical protein n=1 Tax=Cohnella rhizoplanae TaxID=2974897 RepID=UPI0022FF96EB|nr:hypothetical protein [Cohnella sp. JJ-181]CAI6017439.1 hypothetical protein COHCIP112018_00165 [Cohnella sp. JJ-181]